MFEDMQIACDVTHTNTSYILQRQKYSIFQTNQQNLFKLYTSIVSNVVQVSIIYNGHEEHSISLYNFSSFKKAELR